MTRPARSRPGLKRGRILEVAIEQFGRHGYEETKWADIAAAVGIGSTALYHYFESKQHCLFEIMEQAIADFRARFDRIIAEHDDWTEALLAALHDQFLLSDQEVLRLRVLVAEIDRLGIAHPLPREEAARDGARSEIRDLEFAWGAFLARGMQQGLLPESDPRLLTRALLGLANSVWHWYRPGGPLELAEVGRYFIGRELALLGCPPELLAA
jgi:AcrR family transcriptional regulator